MKKIKHLSIACLTLLLSGSSFSQIQTNITGLVSYTSDDYSCDDVTISSTGILQLTGMTLEMRPGVEITIEDGGQLIVDNSTITKMNVIPSGCQFSQGRWRGINFTTAAFNDPNVNPAIVIKNGSVIEESSTAIRGYNNLGNSQKARRVEISNSTFTNNYTHLYLAYSTDNILPNVTNSHSTIHNCTFTNGGNKPINLVYSNDIDFTDNYISGTTSSQFGLSVYNSRNLYFGYNLFENTGPYGMVFYGSQNYTTEDMTLLNNRFYSNVTPGNVNLSGYYYTAIYFGWYAQGQPTGTKTKNIDISYSTLLNTNPNSNETYCGIFTDVLENDNMKIHINYMEDFNVGVELNNCTTANGSYIVENNFQSCQTAIKSTGDNSQLNVSCNKFMDGALGIQVQPGSDLKDQLAFDHMDQYINNTLDIECLSANQFIYSYSNSNSNYATIFNGNIAPVFTPDAAKCEGSGPGQLRQGIAMDDQLSMEIYPNPANAILSIEMSTFSGNGVIQLIDQLGKVVIDQAVHQQIEKLDVSKLQGGLYILQLKSNGETLTEKVIIK